MITPLACSLDGQQIMVRLAPNSRLADLYGTDAARELTTCNYGLAADFADLATSHGMQCAATEADGAVRAVERIDHPFFLATLYQPQLRSRPDAPHPVFLGLLRAALRAWGADAPASDGAD